MNQHLPNHRGSILDELDALVREEVDALAGRRRDAPADAGPDAPEADALADPDDEETFIERTVAYLRDRPDAEALLEAIRATLADAPVSPPPDGSDDPEPSGKTDEAVAPPDAP